MSINVKPYKYKENPNKLKGYLQGLVDGQDETNEFDCFNMRFDFKEIVGIEKIKD